MDNKIKYAAMGADIISLAMLLLAAGKQIYDDLQSPEPITDQQITDKGQQVEAIRAQVNRALQKIE